MTKTIELQGMFKVGDVATLRSGGPDLTVEDIDTSGGLGKAKIHCVWFGSASEVCRAVFPEAVLDPVVLDDPELDAALDASGFSMEALQHLLGGSIEHQMPRPPLAKPHKPGPKPKK